MLRGILDNLCFIIGLVIWVLLFMILPENPAHANSEVFHCKLFAGDYANIQIEDFSENTIADISYIIYEWEMELIKFSDNELVAVHKGTDMTSRLLRCKKSKAKK